MIAASRVTVEAATVNATVASRRPARARPGTSSATAAPRVASVATICPCGNGERDGRGCPSTSGRQLRGGKREVRELERFTLNANREETLVVGVQMSTFSPDPRMTHVLNAEGERVLDSTTLEGMEQAHDLHELCFQGSWARSNGTTEPHYVGLSLPWLRRR